MKLLINASILSDKNTGLGLYTYRILREVCPILIKEGVEIKILCGNKNYLPEELRPMAYEVSFGGFISRNLKMRKAYKGNYDVVWSTTQHGAKTKCKQIITVHDLTPIIYPRGRFHQKVYYKLVLPKLVKRCARIFTVSENTRKDILRFYPKCNPSKIKVLYTALPQDAKDIEETTGVLEEYGLAEKGYFCITGIHYFYKNIHSVIEVYHRHVLDKKVVIIGNDDCDYGRELKQRIAKYGLEENFVFTGFTDNGKKAALISHAFAALYPTKYEGFGLPVLEAMDFGVPVVCSDVSSLPEVGGKAAIYFNPDDIDDIYSKMSYLCEHSEDCEKYVKMGKENLKRFSWETIARNTADAVLELFPQSDK